MARFICDVCGGSIKMQANRTGICSECGMEYDIEAIRVMAGRGGNNPVPVKLLSASGSKRAKNGGIDKASLMIYLYDLRVMESLLLFDNAALGKLKKEKESRESKFKFGSVVKKIRKFNSEPFDNERETATKRETLIKRYTLIAAVVLLVLAAVFFFVGFYIARAKTPEANTTQEIKRDAFLFYVLFVVSLVLAILSAASRLVVRMKFGKLMRNIDEREAEARSKLEEKNSRKEEEFKALKQRFANWEKEYDSMRKDVLRERSLIDSNLRDAYSANIIPLQFRNIEGIYYLYDHLSTSDSNLWEAVMQADPEKTKNQFDSMIKRYSGEIIRRARENAGLDEKQAQIKRVLELGQQNAHTPEAASKYAIIISVNGELCKLLRSEEFTYRTAEEWLKQ